jgi:hypothetical protein
VALHYGHESAGADSATQQFQSVGRRAITLFLISTTSLLHSAAADFPGGADILVNGE